MLAPWIECATPLQVLLCSVLPCCRLPKRLAADIPHLEDIAKAFTVFTVGLVLLKPPRGPM